MASVVNDPNGRKRISFKAGGKRRSLRLGEVPAKAAEDVADKITRIIACLGTPQYLAVDVLRWVNELPAKMYDQLAAAGLFPPRTVREAVTLVRFLDEYFAALRVKPGTTTSYGHTRRCLLGHFGKQTDLLAIGPREADAFHAWMGTHDFAERKAGRGSAASGYRKPAEGEPQKPRTRKLAAATISRRILCARHIFNKALRWGYIKENPFAGVKCGQQRNAARKFFVTQDVIAAALEACPDNQWKLIVILSRYGGLRCPSEHLALKWSDVHWEKNSLTVHSPKTEHHHGGEARILPLFPELRKALQAAYDELPEGAEDWVITRSRSAAANLRTQFLRILKRAGLKPWPRLFQNLRASRETELFQAYPLETACAWIGNTPQVAVIHYLNDPAKDDHFQRAIQEGGVPELTRIPTRPGGESGGMLGKIEGGEEAKTLVIAQEEVLSGGSDWALRDSNTPQNAGEIEGGWKSDAHSDARGVGELAEVAERWALLTAEERERVMRVVRGGTQP